LSRATIFLVVSVKPGPVALEGAMAIMYEFDGLIKTVAFAILWRTCRALHDR
jgi:hypothetical protein